MISPIIIIDLSNGDNCGGITMSILLYVVTLIASVLSSLFLYFKIPLFQNFGEHTKFSIIGFMISSIGYLFCVYWSTITTISYDLFVVLGIYAVVFVILGPLFFAKIKK